jgi:Arc/MetJ-type ribon-helix-helix transcriptional regulator
VKTSSVFSATKSFARESKKGCHSGMTKQIAVRLPDDLVEFIDELVEQGAATSRAAFVTRAIDRERRQAVAARDAGILPDVGSDADLDELAEFAARINPPG